MNNETATTPAQGPDICDGASRARPSHRELLTLLEATSAKEFDLVSQIFAPAKKDEITPWIERVPSTATLIMLALNDWMNANGLLDETDRRRAILAVATELGLFAARFESEERQSPTLRLPAFFTVIDFRFIVVRSLDMSPEKFSRMFDLTEGKTTEKMPYQALTTITCDLNVLLLRLLAKLNRVRELQQRAGAGA